MKISKVNSLFILLIVLFLASCSSRKHTVKPSEKAAKAADAMAALKSKDLYRIITDWSGVKYRLGGLDKNGIDCSGFALLHLKIRQMLLKRLIRVV